MDDSISRQAAIDAIDNWWMIVDDNRHPVDVIKALPSAQPERKNGKWIIRDNPGTGWYRVTCSECGEDVTSTAPVIGFFPDAKVLWDYCPYCGSFNGGEE